MAPTLTLPLDDTEAPTSAPSIQQATIAEDDPWYSSLFKSREHEGFTTETDNSTLTEDTLADDDDDAILEPDGRTPGRKLQSDSLDSLYETNLSAKQRSADNITVDEVTLITHGRKLETDSLDSLYETDLSAKQRSKPNADIREHSVDTPFQTRKLEADKFHSAYESEGKIDQGRQPKGQENFDLLTSHGYIETMTIEDIIKEEHKLEAVLEKQQKLRSETKVEISYLRNKNKHYLEEINRIEYQLGKLS